MTVPKILKSNLRPGIRLSVQDYAQCKEIHAHLNWMTMTQVARMALSAGFAQIIGQYLAAKQSERPNG